MKKILKFTEHPIIATLVTSAILAIIATIKWTTIFDTFIQWTKTAFSYLLNSILFVLTYEVAIWKIIVLSVIIVAIFVLFIKWMAQQKNNAETVAPNQVTTTTLENRILNLLKQNYQTRHSITDIDRNVAINNMLLTEQTVEKLTYDKHLLERHEHYMEGITFYLSTQGRDYVLANGHIFS